MYSSKFREGVPGHQRFGERFWQPRPVCADLVRLVIAEHELVTSEFVLDELKRALRDKFGVPEATIQEILALLRGHHVQATPQTLPSIKVRDPDDVLVLACALDARADVLVTGDADLLSLKDKAPIPIASPRGFWEMLKQGRQSG